MAAPTITCPEGAGTLEGASRGGDYQISWSGSEGASFRLVELEAGAPIDSSVVLYEGPQRASTVTGRAEGDYGYAVAELGGDQALWSEICQVKVRPYPLTLAFTFFAFGLLVTLATVALIVRGHRAHKRGAIG
jgi:hypothetical protein